jgi:hypothetical protein
MINLKALENISFSKRIKAIKSGKVSILKKLLVMKARNLNKSQIKKEKNKWVKYHTNKLYLIHLLMINNLKIHLKIKEKIKKWEIKMK